MKRIRSRTALFAALLASTGFGTGFAYAQSSNESTTPQVQSNGTTDQSS